MAYMKFVGKTDTEKYKDDATFKDLINYIGNPMKAISIGFANVNALETAADEMETVAMQGRKSAGKKICHIVITFAPQELRCLSMNTLEGIAKRCVNYFAARYQVVYAIHNYPQDHIHLVFNRVSPVDFKRYPDRYEDRERFWTFLHHILFDYNIRLRKN